MSKLNQTRRTSRNSAHRFLQPRQPPDYDYNLEKESTKQSQLSFDSSVYQDVERQMSQLFAEDDEEDTTVQRSEPEKPNLFSFLEHLTAMEDKVSKTHDLAKTEDLDLILIDQPRDELNDSIDLANTENLILIDQPRVELNDSIDLANTENLILIDQPRDELNDSIDLAETEDLILIDQPRDELNDSIDLAETENLILIDKPRDELNESIDLAKTEDLILIDKTRDELNDSIDLKHQKLLSLLQNRNESTVDENPKQSNLLPLVENPIMAEKLDQNASNQVLLNRSLTSENVDDWLESMLYTTDNAPVVKTEVEFPTADVQDGADLPSWGMEGAGLLPEFQWPILPAPFFQDCIQTIQRDEQQIMISALSSADLESDVNGVQQESAPIPNVMDQVKIEVPMLTNLQERGSSIQNVIDKPDDEDVLTKNVGEQASSIQNVTDQMEGEDALTQNVEEQVSSIQNVTFQMDGEDAVSMNVRELESSNQLATDQMEREDALTKNVEEQVSSIQNVTFQMDGEDAVSMNVREPESSNQLATDQIEGEDALTKNVEEQVSSIQNVTFQMDGEDAVSMNVREPESSNQHATDQMEGEEALTKNVEEQVSSIQNVTYQIDGENAVPTNVGEQGSSSQDVIDQMDRIDALPKNVGKQKSLIDQIDGKEAMTKKGPWIQNVTDHIDMESTQVPISNSDITAGFELSCPVFSSCINKEQQEMVNDSSKAKADEDSVDYLTDDDSESGSNAVEAYTVTTIVRWYKCRLCDDVFFLNQHALLNHLEHDHNAKILDVWFKEQQQLDNGKEDEALGHVQLFNKMFPQKEQDDDEDEEEEEEENEYSDFDPEEEDSEPEKEDSDSDYSVEVRKVGKKKDKRSSKVIKIVPKDPEYVVEGLGDGSEDLANEKENKGVERRNKKSLRPRGRPRLSISKTTNSLTNTRLRRNKARTAGDRSKGSMTRGPVRAALRRNENFCHFCGQGYSRFHDLKRHVLTIHALSEKDWTGIRQLMGKRRVQQVDNRKKAVKIPGIQSAMRQGIIGNSMLQQVDNRNEAVVPTSFPDKIPGIQSDMREGVIGNCIVQQVDGRKESASISITFLDDMQVQSGMRQEIAENDIAQLAEVQKETAPFSFSDKNIKMEPNDISFPDKTSKIDSEGVVQEVSGNGIVQLGNGQKETCPTLSTDKTKRKGLRCPICDHMFVSDSGLKMHKSIFHNMDVKWNCIACNQYFVFYSTFQGHLKNTPPFAGIDAASYGFSQSQMDTPYGCGRCEKNFANKNCFTFHSHTHEETPERLKFRCNLCNTLQSSSNMDRHFEAHKNRSRHISKFSTSKTNKSPRPKVPLTLPPSLSGPFQKRSPSIGRHLENHNPHARRPSNSNTSPNSRPGVSITPSLSISLISTAPEKCPNCKEEFWNQLGFQKHLKTCEWRKNKSFECRLCEKRFKTDEARFLHFQQDHRPVLRKQY